MVNYFITHSSFWTVVFCIALVAAWPSRKWLLPDLVMVAIVAETTVSAGLGAGFTFAIHFLIMFTAYVAVGSLGAFSNLRSSKQFSLKVFDPIFDRILRVGLSSLLSIAVSVVMVMV